ncbi:hypothetical protein BJ978_001969 [Agromyces terreus]|uniref:Spore protein YkvP/CgeB glycosyl transferase-like domain-containing protein n=1 Tax=Agromyces terreus TaxID=424795 RepID=A0A9X2H1K2_9MICO|nr:glycosyltransferase [Agromyces terreus]MCP2371293.1 hypothetical protein [Agromyces terreus]
MAERSALRRAAWRALGAMPEGLQLRVNPSKYGFAPGDRPPPPVAPATPVRLYVGAVNSAGQGFAWARAAERLPGVGAVDLQHRGEGGFGFPSDYSVPTTVFVRSEAWQRAHFRAVSRSFTHVIAESVWPLFTSRFDDDVEREVDAMRDAGVRVAILAHGSDIRLPNRHALIDEWSPFREGVWDATPTLQRQADAKHAILERLDVPVFVSTPDLLGDWPAATVLPLVVDTDRWRVDAEPLEREVPVVVHAPSRAVVKGTDAIRPVMHALAERGVVDYREFSGIPSAEMPARIADADIVLEQFRIGTYSVAAVEAMAAGRVVVGHVHEQVREYVRSAYGRELPVVQATPDTLEEVLLDLIARPDHARSIAAAGADFVRSVHDGRTSAQVLRPFLLG